MAEVIKARKRRLAEGWFEKYCPENKCGIDIGCGDDPVNETFRRWDQKFGDGDATFMKGVSDNKFWTVHASHVLEHLHDPVTGIKNWFRILHPGGHLIICVPHRDLYEKKKTLPSQWNFDHKAFWLPESEESPDTRSLKGSILQAIPNANIVSLIVLNEGWVPKPQNEHSCGEYSIEAIIKK